MGDNLFVEFDNEIESINAAIKYAEEHFNELVARRENSVRTVYTTLGYELGIASPDLINHRVIGGHKRGRIIKEKNETEGYCEIGYDENDKPVHFTHINSFGTESADFFFEYNGYHWAVQLCTDKESKYYGKNPYNEIIKYCYDEQGRILYYAEISTSSISANKYEYPENETDPIICRSYYYVPNLSKSSKDIPAGYEHSPMHECLYEISPDMKVIRDYYKYQGKNLFSDAKYAQRAKNPQSLKLPRTAMNVLLNGLTRSLRRIFRPMAESTLIYSAKRRTASACRCA